MQSLENTKVAIVGLGYVGLPLAVELASSGYRALGFDVLEGETAIVPVMLYDAKLASAFADEMLKEGIYVIGFSYPVVPKGKARIRTQISAAHEREHLDRAVAAFERVGRRLGVLK